MEPCIPVIIAIPCNPGDPGDFSTVYTVEEVPNAVEIGPTVYADIIGVDTRSKEDTWVIC